MKTSTENRREMRTDLCWPVSIWLPEAKRFFNARSANISKSGVYLNTSVATPIRTGHMVELNFPRTDKLAEEKGGYARIKYGRVVRIDRANMLKDATMGIAVAFN